MKNDKLWYQITNLKNKSAKILIYDRIGTNFWGEGVSAKQLVKDIQALDVNTIKVHINSPGGNVFDGNAIYNALVAHKATIEVKIDGIAASIASVVAMSGESVEMPENAMMMVHNPQGGVVGSAIDMRKIADALDKVKLGLVAAYRDKSGLKDDEVSGLMDDETWITAQEAIDYGFADKMTARVAIQANIEDFSQFKNVPADFLSSLSNKMPKKEKRKMEITLDLIRDKYSEIAKALIEEGKKTGIDEGETAGAKKERARIKAVRGQLIPGHEKLVDGLMWDGETTGEQAAVKVLAAEKSLRQVTLDKQTMDAPKAVAQPANDDAGTIDPDLPIEEKCKATWKKDKELQAEFNGDFEAYQAAEKAMAAGLVKVIAKK